MSNLRFLHSPLPAAILVVAAAGCEAPGSGDGVERWMAGDTLVVHSTRPVLSDTVRMREVLRIGSASGPLEYLFTSIRAIGVGPDGDIFVYDTGEGIRHFSPDGRFLGWLARRGSGPTEIKHVTAIDVSKGGTVAVQDLGNRRVSVFFPGDSVVNIPGPNGRPAFSDEDALLFHEDGELWVKLHPFQPPLGGITHPRPTHARVELSNETFVDTVFTPENAAKECTTLTERPFMVGIWEDKRERWLPKTLWAMGPDGTFALGCPKTYEFRLVKPSGRKLKISRNWTPRHEDEEARDAYEAHSSLGRPPSVLPAYSQIILPEDGRIWVWPTVPSEPRYLSEADAERFGFRARWLPGVHGVFDVFGPDGRWLAVVQPPPGFAYSGFPTTPAAVIRGDTIWAMARDSLDLNYVVRCEIEWPGPPPDSR